MSEYSSYDYMKIFNKSMLLQAGLIAIFSTIIVRYQLQLLNYLEWGDEVTHIISVKLINSGSELYSQIHELHGPLTFLPGLLVEKINHHFGVWAYRIPIMLLQWLALISLYFSPLFKKQSLFLRLTYCVAAATVMLIYFADIFGHTYLFQVIAGLFFIIILSQYTLPAILMPTALNSSRIIAGNLLIVSLPFLAFTYIPICILLFFASFHRQFTRLILLSAGIGLALNIAFLAVIGSIAGYFAMHFWINFFVSRQYIEGEVLGIQYLLNSAYIGITNDLARFGIFLIFISALTSLGKNERKFPWRSFVLGLGIASLLVRAIGFQGLPLLYLFLAMPLIFIFRVSKTNGLTAFFLSPILLICFVKLILLVPANIIDRQARTSSPFAELVQKITEKDDRIIAWPFENYEYILADRLPASGNFFYLPWQKDYYENPKFGISIDSCREIINTKPKIMLINPYPFGGVEWQQFIPSCILDLIKTDYTQVPNSAYFVRNDIYRTQLKIILQN